MEVAQILEELAYDMGVFPREAIEAAISKRRMITPYLLKILEDASEQIEEVIEFDNYQGHLYAMYLLAQFREQAAYPFIVKLISYPGDIPHSIVGDVLTEDLSRILASVSAGDSEPMQALIENSNISEYVRAAAQTSMVTLVGCGMESRDRVMAYFKSLFEGKLEKRPSFVWDNLISCCCDLYPEEVIDPIREAFTSSLVDPCFISLEEIGAIFAESKENHLSRLFQNAELIDDTVTEMEKWLSTH
jgi:hypothetical protein